MLEKTIKIQGLEFLQINVFGEYLPLFSSIESALVEIKDLRNKKKFQRLTNEFTAKSYDAYIFPINIFDAYSCLSWYDSLDRENFSAIELRIMLCQNILEQCNIVGYDFCAWMQSSFTMTWFDFLRGNVGLGDIQNRRKIITTLLSIPDNNTLNKLIRKKFIPNKEIDSRKELSRLFDDYRKSVEYLDSFRKGLFESMKYEPALVYYVMAEFETEKQLLLMAEASPKMSGVLFCRQCKKRTVVEQGNTPILCNDCNKRKTEMDTQRRLDDQKKY